ncbi:uncharacterized protein LOC109503991, partial [Harpegnathos saltator]|uniref:uncharacterized protein LOC109503991 n=1 Tax=Harpegnathos saltator TaxID=610380 RepID=UPI000DBEE0C2
MSALSTVPIELWCSPMDAEPAECGIGGTNSVQSQTFRQLRSAKMDFLMSHGAELAEAQLEFSQSQDFSHRSFCSIYRNNNATLFEALLILVGPIIAKKYIIREPISPDTRLQITLRYLASGDSMKSLSYSFRVAHNTISKIISETCEVIWICLKDTIFIKDNEESWATVVYEFEQLWNFPNCIGAIDGKHVQIQAPANSGSTYYNYKSHH